MARKNRVVLRDAVYHITSRIAHREFLFANAGFKDRIAEWIHDIADFSGVEVYAWSIMDNHFHLVVHVPSVPEAYWIDPTCEPDSQAFGMRPAECRVPRWSPDKGDRLSGPMLSSNLSNGNSPRENAQARPSLGFMLSDEEMLGRLRSLYGNPKRIARLRRAWSEMRKNGNGAAVDAIKERYSRRMYNISQFVKTLKERIAMVYNYEFKHEGAIWQGRFYSSVVEDSNEVLAIVAAYDDYNPVKAGVVDHPSKYKWCSFGSAMSDEGKFSDRSREGYEKMFGCPWERARSIMEVVFTLKGIAVHVPEGPGDETMNAAVAIRHSIPAFTRGVYIGHDPLLVKEVTSVLPRNFPRASFSAALAACSRFIWDQVA